MIAFNTCITSKLNNKFFGRFRGQIDTNWFTDINDETVFRFSTFNTTSFSCGGNPCLSSGQSGGSGISEVEHKSDLNGTRLDPNSM